MHCSLPLRQLSELPVSYLLQCFNLFICHLVSLPICHFGKLLRKTSAYYFGKLRKPSENYFGKLENFGKLREKYRRKLLRPKSRDENSSDRSLWKVFLNLFCPRPLPLQIKLGWPITVNCSGIKENNLK